MGSRELEQPAPEQQRAGLGTLSSACSTRRAASVAIGAVQACRRLAAAARHAPRRGASWPVNGYPSSGSDQSMCRRAS